MPTVGERIKVRRVELGMTQADLAKAVGTTYQAISKYENDLIGTIPTKKLAVIAKALDCSPVYLLGMEEPTHDFYDKVEDYRDQLKDNPDLRMLLRAAADLKPDEIQQLVNLAKMIRK